MVSPPEQGDLAGVTSLPSARVGDYVTIATSNVFFERRRARIWVHETGYPSFPSEKPILNMMIVSGRTNLPPQIFSFIKTKVKTMFGEFFFFNFEHLRGE